MQPLNIFSKTLDANVKMIWLNDKITNHTVSGKLVLSYITKRIQTRCTLSKHYSKWMDNHLELHSQIGPGKPILGLKIHIYILIVTNYIFINIF